MGLHGIGCMGQDKKAIVLNGGFWYTAAHPADCAATISAVELPWVGVDVSISVGGRMRFVGAIMTDQTCGHKEQRSLPSCSFR